MAKKVVVEVDVKTDTSSVEQLNKKLGATKEKIEDIAGARSKEANATKKVTDEVVSNGGAVAILDQLTGGLASQFKNAYESTRLFNISLKGTKKALIATGVGALVVALGTIIAYWDEIKELINGTNKRLERQHQLQTEIINTQNQKLKTLKVEFDFLKASGLATENNKNKQKELLKELIKTTEANLTNLETQLKLEESKKRELGTWDKIKIAALEAAGQYGAAAKIRAEAIIGTDEERERLNKLKSDLETAKQSLLGLKTELITIDAPEIIEPKLPTEDKKDSKLNIKSDSELQKEKEQRDKEIEDRLDALQTIEDAENEYFDSKLTKEQQEVNAVADKYFQLIENAKLYNQDTQILEEAQRVALQEIEDRYNAQKLEKANKITEQELELEQKKRASKQQTLDNLIAIGGAETGFGKAMLVAKQLLAAKELIQDAKKSITLATNAGIRSTVAVAEGAGQTAKIGFPQNIPMLIGYAAQAVGIISSIKSAISKTKGASAGVVSGGGGGGISAPSVPSAPPSFNIVGSSDTNQLAEAIGSQEQKPVKAYVTSNDVTTAQGLDRNIVEGASIG